MFAQLLWAVAVDLRPAIPIRNPDPPVSSLRSGTHGSHGCVQPLRVQVGAACPWQLGFLGLVWALGLRVLRFADGALSLPVLSQTSISSLIAQACRRHKKAGFHGRKRPVRKKKSTAAL